ncbi:hypothetical protein EON83_25270 [bacterium]|nr:MAG: hypothetical protein EON83_25270 [bacterium]
MKLWSKFSLGSKAAPVQSYATVFQQQIEADRVFRGIPHDVEGFRAKFRCNLIGQWQTESSYDMMTTTTWNFYANGTAQQINTSMITGDSEHYFRWREKSPFAIEMCQSSDDEDSANWFLVQYNFKTRNGQVILAQVPESSTFKFYLTTDYPVFQGDHA